MPGARTRSDQFRDAKHRAHLADRVTLSPAWPSPTAVMRKERTIGRKHIVPYALYRAEGYISTNLAKQTGFSKLISTSSGTL